jgi:hypothetical protein
MRRAALGELRTRYSPARTHQELLFVLYAPLTSAFIYRRQYHNAIVFQRTFTVFCSLPDSNGLLIGNPFGSYALSYRATLAQPYP